MVEVVFVPRSNNIAISPAQIILGALPRLGAGRGATAVRCMAVSTDSSPSWDPGDALHEKIYRSTTAVGPRWGCPSTL